MLAGIATAWAVPQISLLTALPGCEIYELEGHTALRIQDPEEGTDAVVNWGVFDFNSPGFVWRFVKGETDYMCAAQPTQPFLDSYARQGRVIVEQSLALSEQDAGRLIDLVMLNLRPDNCVYRYNYVKDNCATRPLLLLEDAVSRQIVPDSSEFTTFRREMRSYHRLYPWYQFGIDLALGSGIDYPIGPREASFAPVYLMERMVRSGDVSDTHIYQPPTLVTPTPTPWWATPMAVALLMLALAAACCFAPAKTQRIFDTILFTGFGLAGCLIFFLVFVSTHEATSPNLVMLWLNPLCLLGAVLPWIKSAQKWQICYFFANFALVMLLAILAPLTGQSLNAAFWPLMAADALRSAYYIKPYFSKV